MDTITLFFVHDHECRHKGERIRVLPRTSTGAFYAERLICIETGIECAMEKVTD